MRNKQGKVVAIKRVLMPVEKPKLTRAQLLSEIGFDLLVAKCCLALDIMANVLVTALPVPAFQHLAKRPKAGVSALESQLLFVGATSLGSTGSGVVPSLASVALGLGQVREMEGGEVKSSEMLGALSVVQVVGQMIFGVSAIPRVNYTETDSWHSPSSSARFTARLWACSPKASLCLRRYLCSSD